MSAGVCIAVVTGVDVQVSRVVDMSEGVWLLGSEAALSGRDTFRACAYENGLLPWRCDG